MNTAKLRNCSARVESYKAGEANGYKHLDFVDCVTGEVVELSEHIDVLISYSTVVCIYDRFYDHLLFLPKWDCSVTTQKHVRYFLDDYAGVNAYSADIRKALKDASNDFMHAVTP